MQPANAKIIFEIGLNHLGDQARALRMMEAVAQQGGHYATIQVITNPAFYIRDAKRAGGLQRFCLSKEDNCAIIRHGVRLGLKVGAVVVDPNDVPDLIAAGATFFKILSTDITFESLYTALAKTGLPIYVSTGASLIEEIARMVEGMRTASDAADIRLIHTVLSVPTPADRVNLRNIQTLQQKFQVPVAYGHHSDDRRVLSLAIALEVEAVLVYIAESFDPNLPDGPHAILCSEIKKIIEMTDHTQILLGTPERSLTPNEEKLRQTNRRSIVAARPIHAGAPIDRDDIGFMQPATGIPPWDLSQVLGQTTQKDFSPGNDIIF